MKIKRIFERAIFLLNVILVCLCANCFFLVRRFTYLIPVFIVLLILSNFLPIYSSKSFPNKAIKICNHGTKTLMIFLLSTTVSVIYHIITIYYVFQNQPSLWIYSAIICVCVLNIIFWNGIISVYCTSTQLGIKLRVLGIVLGPIPIAHIFMLRKIIHITSAEVKLETEKYQLNLARKGEQICKTKYPLLLVHGVFFRDFKHLNYWGRIPKELIDNGATIFYGEHQSAASVQKSAEEIAEKIKQIIAQTGCEKVNIIAHSKGGLDCRYAIAQCDIAPFVASLTTISTPHRGCGFVDYLFEKMPDVIKQNLAKTYNATLRRLGDTEPDFLVALSDLTTKKCEVFDKELPLPEGIYCSSVGTKLNHATSGKFPLNYSYHLVKHFDGANDGLVGEQSFQWGESYTYLTVSGKRGISHGDMIDLNRENIKDFDVREFYVKLVSDLKQRGL